MQSLRDFAAKLRTPNHQRALAYGMTNFSAAVLNNIFITYYVEMAVSVSKVSEGWFMSAQVIYCVWNSFNDPACGWWADTHGVEGAAGTMQRRLPRILRGGPPWAAAFVMMWFPWGIGTTSPVLAGLHLITVLLLYDGWLSYTLINHQALLADMTSDNVERERCNMYGAACQIAGSGAIFMAHLYWDTRDLNAFRGFAVAAALVSCGGFFITAKSPYIDEGACRAAQSSSKHYADKADTPSLSTFVKQTLRHRNLWSFILMGLLQQFACTFTTNFFSMFLTLLVGRYLNPAAQSGILYASFILPHFGTMLITPILRRVSKKSVVMAIFMARVAVCIVGMYLVSLSLNIPFLSVLRGVQEADEVPYEGRVPLAESAVALVKGMIGNHTTIGDGHAEVIHVQSIVSPDSGQVSWLAWVIALSLLINRVLTENVCRLEPLLITDLIDEDCVINDRKVPMSSMIFGSVALFTKPAQSLAPIFGMYFLSRTSHSDLSLWLCVLSLSFAVPLFVTLFEILTWTQYKLTGKYLKQIKMALTELAHDNII